MPNKTKAERFPEGKVTINPEFAHLTPEELQAEIGRRFEKSELFRLLVRTGKQSCERLMAKRKVEAVAKEKKEEKIS